MKEHRITAIKRSIIAMMWVLMIGGWSCTKTSPALADTEAHADKAALDDNKPRLEYKDSILYFTSFPRNYSVRPVKIPKQPGYFVASPEGLQINASNGMIDVNTSEAGLRYMIYYMSRDNSPIDSATMTIAGIDYEDGVFELAATPEHDNVVPVYKGAGDKFPCDTAGADSLGQCVFDETDLDGDGVDDVDGANKNKLRVNSKNGKIDLEQSLEDGVFGSPNPVNGAFKDFTIRYRLRDASRNALNKITVRIYHFNHREDIPVWLIDELARRKQGNQISSAEIAGAPFVQSNALLLAPKRPPLIIIVSGLVAR